MFAKLDLRIGFAAQSAAPQIHQSVLEGGIEGANATNAR
jgi:hypothetical protein